MKPCIECGEPSDDTRCEEHRREQATARRGSARERGYDRTWDKLSKRARDLQPWCSDCYTTNDLTTDHLPSAWLRKAAGKVIRLRDVDVVCGPCNTRRGSSRPGATEPLTGAQEAAQTHREGPIGEAAPSNDREPFSTEAAGVRPGVKGKLVNGEIPLPFNPPASVESERFLAFAEDYLRVPKGTGAKEKLQLRDWQVEIAKDVLDSGARTVGLMLPRGQGKTALTAAISLYMFFTWGEGANVVVVAVDERQATLAFTAARRMVELSEDLATRCHIYRDRLVLPLTDSTFQVLPASPAALEGLDYVAAIVDEAGVVNRDVFEVVQLAQGKRERSVLVAIGTPGPKLEDQVLLSLRQHAAEQPDDASLKWREYSAAGFEDHPVDCAHCWELANPALDDFLHRDALQALLPPKTRESTFRRARLCQLASDTDGAFLPSGVWESLNTGEQIPDGTDVVLALDGSFSDDTTALLLGTVATDPHFDVLQVWERPPGDDSYRVPVADVEQAIRDACKKWNVVEIIADPFRWTRTLQALEAERLPVVEFPHSPSRLTAATGDLYSAAVNGRMTHSGDPRLAAHVGAAVISEDARGMRLAKASRSRHARKIDLAACLVMAHSRATWRATRPTRKKTRGFR